MKTSTTARKPWPLQVLIGCGVAAFWLLLWEGGARLVGQPYLLPGPWPVLQTLWQLAGTAELWLAAGASLLRVLIGFAAGVIAGCALALLTAHFRPAHTLLAPLLGTVRCVPVASFILLAYVWIQSDLLPAVIAFLMVLPMIWASTEKGLRQTDIRLLELAKVCRLGAWRTFVHIRVPSVMPYLLPAMQTGLGFAWKSGIAAEIISHTAASVGQYMYEAKLYFDMPALFAWTALIVLLSLGVEAVLSLPLRRLGRRFREVA